MAVGLSNCPGHVSSVRGPSGAAVLRLLARRFFCAAVLAKHDGS